MGRLGSRQVGIWLHWATALLTVAVAVASDPDQARVLGGLYAAVGAAFVLRALAFGPLTRPGPKLSGAARWLHLGLHRGLLAVLAGVIATGLATGMAGPGVAEALGPGGPAVALWHSRLYAALFAFAAGHIVFNTWRGMELGERPFSAMLPRM